MNPRLAVVACITVLGLGPVARMAAADVPPAVNEVRSYEGFEHALSLNWNYQDIDVAQPLASPSSPLSVGRGATAGFGLTYFQKLGSSSNWFLNAGGSYDLGSSKDVFVGSVPFTDKVSIRSWSGEVGLGYLVPLTSKAFAYARGDAFYSSTTGSFDFSGATSATRDSQPWKVFGAEKAFGGGVRIAPRINLYGETYSQFGWGSVSDGRSEHRETVKYGCYRGGLMRSF
jgi:hypothetical protein